MLLLQDAPEAPSVLTSETTPSAPPPQPWRNQQLSDVSALLPNERDASQWAHNDEVYMHQLHMAIYMVCCRHMNFLSHYISIKCGLHTTHNVICLAYVHV